MATILTSVASFSIPAFYFALSSVFSFIALHVHPSKRLIYLPLIVIPAILSFNNIERLPEWLGLNNIWGFTMTIFIAHITAVLYVEKFVLLPSNPDGSPPPVLVTAEASQTLTRWDLRAAYRVWNNPRWLRFANDKQVPAKPYDRRKSEEKRPSYWQLRFLFKCSARIAMLWLSQHVFMQYTIPFLLRSSTIDNFRPEVEPLLSRLPFNSFPFLSRYIAPAYPITYQELSSRLAITLTWAVLVYISLNICHILLSIFFILVMRLDMPEDWPPLFGSVSNMTSIRGFWGGFWHRLVVKGYGSHVALLSRSVMRWNAGKLEQKLFLLFGIFLASGFAHSAVAWKLSGPGCGFGRDTWWFIENWLAGLGEVILLKLINGLVTRVGLKNQFEGIVTGRVGKALGAVWVFLFFFWTVPMWQYPKFYCAVLHQTPDVSMELDLSGL